MKLTANDMNKTGSAFFGRSHLRQKNARKTQKNAKKTQKMGENKKKWNADGQSKKKVDRKEGD
jgi:hypothetical protein